MHSDVYHSFILIFLIVWSRLSNLFNALPRTSPVRLLVFKTFLKLALENDELDVLHLTPNDVDRWLTEWNASDEEKADFIRTVADAFTSAGEP